MQRGWLCLPDAQRYYTTLQFWQVTGSADGVRSKMGVSFWLSLESYTGFRNQLLWSPPNLDHTPADGVYPGFLALFSPYLVSYAGCGRDARAPKGICNNLGCTRCGKPMCFIQSGQARRPAFARPGTRQCRARFKVADLIVLVELTAETRRGTKRKSYLSRCERSSHLADPNRLGHPGADRTDARPHSTGRAGQSGPLIRGLSYCPRSCGRPRPLVGIQT